MNDQREIMVFIKGAKYYREEKSIVITGEEVETKRTITQQMLVKDFIQEYGLQVREDDADAWRFFANQLKYRRDPFKLVFLDTRNEDDPI